MLCGSDFAKHALVFRFRHLHPLAVALSENVGSIINTWYFNNLLDVRNLTCEGAPDANQARMLKQFHGGSRAIYRFIR